MNNVRGVVAASKGAAVRVETILDSGGSRE